MIGAGLSKPGKGLGRLGDLATGIQPLDRLLSLFRPHFGHLPTVTLYAVRDWDRSLPRSLPQPPGSPVPFVPPLSLQSDLIGLLPWLKSGASSTSPHTPLWTPGSLQSGLGPPFWPAHSGPTLVHEAQPDITACPALRLPAFPRLLPDA